ncbi:hypothetical protein C8R43DRAFT_892731 [Mycena crocata]|nr:hypothetical protein C8R43DRAFT_892731 [Mycena crocata]
MATIARNYHNRIQFDRQDTTEEVRNATIETVLDRTSRKTTPAQNEELRAKLTRDDVRIALRRSANNKGPGLDGSSYELWKTLDARHVTAVSLDKPGFDILEVLKTVYNDIETNGIVQGTKFAESWMCPLYKKNDRADIANYRPISLLNTDYKYLRRP